AARVRRHDRRPGQGPRRLCHRNAEAAVLGAETQVVAEASGDPSLGGIAQAHRFDEAALDAYLQTHIEGFGQGLEIKQFQGGASNPTFLLTTDGGAKRYVLRKKPPGVLLPSAHQVDREYRIMKALGPTGVPVPTMRVLCQDDSIIGTDFY